MQMRFSCRVLVEYLRSVDSSLSPEHDQFIGELLCDIVPVSIEM